ncbi:MAG TPA: hypothetical protein DEA08_05755, partial [Planctomycetes bacterium]|nr:hypothetical protein [Planctomycetota bacterium]
DDTTPELAPSQPEAAEAPQPAAAAEPAPESDAATPLLVGLLALALVAVLGFAFTRGGPQEAAGPAGTDPKQLLEQGREIGKTQHLKDALPYFQKAVQLAPDDVEARAVLGRALLQLRRTPEATPVLQRACELAPERADVHRMLGVCLTDAGQFEAARAPLQRALELEPGDVEPHYYLGVGAQQLGEPEEVVAHLSPYVRASRNGPRVSLALTFLTGAHEALGQRSETIACLQSLVAINPVDIAAQRTLQRALLERDGFDATRAATLARISSESHPIYDFLAGELLSKHPAHLDQARAAYARSCERAPQAWQGWASRLDLALRRADHERAEALCAELPEPLREHPELALLRGRLDLVQGRYEQARQRFTPLLEAEQQLPSRLVADARLGTLRSHLAEGKGEEALGFVRGLFAFLEPGDPRHKLEAETLQTLGKFDEALAIYGRLIGAGLERHRPLWRGLRTYVYLDADRGQEAKAAFEELLKLVKDQAPAELALWAGLSLAPDELERARALWKQGAAGPRFGESCWWTYACERLLGGGDPRLLENAGAIGGYLVGNDVAYVEGRALQLAGDSKGATAAYQRGLERSFGEEFPARLLRRALEP